MKKILAMMLTASMMLSMGSVAFAEGEEDDSVATEDTYISADSTDDLSDYLDKTIYLPKTYQVNSGTAPGATFTFMFEGISYVNNKGETVADATIPAIENISIEFADAAITETTTVTGEVVIDPENYELGIYTYKVTEVIPAGTESAGEADTTVEDPKILGITYSEEELYLVLTILREADSEKHYVAAMHYQTTDGTKSGGFTNEYDSGTLSVTKNVTGNMADLEKKFDFTIELTAPAGTNSLSGITYTVSGAESSTADITSINDTAVIGVTLGKGDSIFFENLPAGMEYRIYENAEGYIQTVTGETIVEHTSVTNGDGETTDVGTAVTGVIAAGDEDKAEFNNSLVVEVDTGIRLDSIPYIVILAVVILGTGAAVIGKRFTVND